MKRKVAFIFLIALIIFAVLLHHYHIDNVFSLSNIKTYQSATLYWIERYVFFAYFFYFIVYLFLNTCHIPLATPVIPILGGFFLNIYVVIPLVALGMMLSFLIKCLLVRYAAFHAEKDNKLAKKIDFLLPHFNKHKFYYFFSSRFIPLFPRWLVILLAARSNLTCKQLLTWSIPCSIVMATLYVYLGLNLDYYLNKNYLTWQAILAEPAVYLPLILIGGFSLLPLALPRRMKKEI